MFFEGLVGLLVIEDKGAAIYGFSLKRLFLSRQCKNRHGKNDISCVIPCMDSAGYYVLFSPFNSLSEKKQHKKYHFYKICFSSVEIKMSF